MSKCIFLGNSCAGKSTLLLRLMNRPTGKTERTLGPCFSSTEIELEGRSFKYALWDTAGEERYSKLSKMYCRDARFLVLVYDVSDRSSFEKIPDWLENAASVNPPNSYFVFLVANKVDLRDSKVPSSAALPASSSAVVSSNFVGTEEGCSLASQIHASAFIECSAKLGTGLENFLQLLARCEREGGLHLDSSNFVSKGKSKPLSLINPSNSSVSKKGKCCGS